MNTLDIIVCNSNLLWITSLLQHGTKYARGHPTALQIICGSLRPDRPALMLEAVRLIAPFCIIEGGQSAVLNALTLTAEEHGTERFRAIVKGLDSDQDALRKHCLQMINALLDVEDYDFRVHLRNEFMRCGMLAVYEKLIKEEHLSVDLGRQFTVFKNSLEDDLDELTQKHESIAQDFFDLQECFDMIKASVTDTPAASAFLSILQHLLLIRDDAQIRLALSGVLTMYKIDLRVFLSVAVRHVHFQFTQLLTRTEKHLNVETVLIFYHA